MVRSAKNGGVEIGLNAAIVTMDGAEPMFLTVTDQRVGLEDLTFVSDQGDVSTPQLWGLPYGRFEPLEHRTMEMAVRGFVKIQTGLDLEYIEQLYTFGDRGRAASSLGLDEMHVVSIGYLALTRMRDRAPTGAIWRRWYGAFPWEDWREGAPKIIASEILPRLESWARRHTSDERRRRALDRVHICFTDQAASWDEEKVLDRYELLYEAGLVLEARRDGRKAALSWEGLPNFGEPLMVDHRRILATAMSRMRAKIKYRPVIFDLMAARFTLLELQQTVEAISGGLLHKQNFRRLVLSAGLVVETGEMSSETGGRPAKLFRFRKEVLLERRTAGVRVRS